MTGQLEQLAIRATVRIGPDAAPGTLWGSGFLVAPGWVLTCAHVLHIDGDVESVGTLRVQGHRLDTPARLAYWLGGGTDPEQDLALVRLKDDAADGHACVRLTDRYDPPHQVTAFGWRTPTGGAPQRWNGHSECNGRDGSYGFTLAPHMEIPHGASGGPCWTVTTESSRASSRPAAQARTAAWPSRRRLCAASARRVPWAARTVWDPTRTRR